jgi:FHS family L-fucose permease-like MFS transporter
MNSSASSHSPRPLLYTVYFIYFFCGLTLCFEGAFNPEFKEYFGLSYQQQMYTMFAKNIPFVLALGIGFLIPRLGYKNCLTIGMALFALGTLLLVPGLGSGSYAVVLLSNWSRATRCSPRLAPPTAAQAGSISVTHSGRSPRSSAR